MKRFVSFLLVLSAVLVAAAAYALAVPPLQGRVVDLADLMPSDAEQRLSERLASYEQQTGHQFAVLTIPSLEGDPLEDFSIRVVEAWKLGKKKVDDGVLLLVVKNEHKARVEVGYGLEGSITDAQSARVIRNVLTPAFRSGDFAGGIDATMTQLMTLGAGGKLDLPAESERPPERRGNPAILILLFFGLPVLLPLLLGRHGPGGRGRFYGGGFYGGGFGGGGFGGGGGGGGGFSGGGGGFGGGGASGSW